MKEAAEPELEPVITNHDFGYIQPGKLKEKLIAAIISKGSVYFQNTEHKALFPKEISQKKKRSLTSSWFTFKLPSGETCNKSWLLFSPSLESLFCFPCMLFSEEPSNMISFLAKPGVGFTQCKKPEKLKDHEEGIYHRRAFLKWKLEEEKIKDEEDELTHMFNLQFEKNRQYWKEILRRIASTVKFLVKSNLSFSWP